MKFTIDKNLIKKIEEEMLTDYCTQDCYDDETKVWIDVKEIEPMIDELLNKIDEVRYAYREYRAYQERDKSDDFIPEREIPEIHGKGISY